jgi:hypothetical protein
MSAKTRKFGYDWIRTWWASCACVNDSPKSDLCLNRPPPKGGRFILGEKPWASAN